MSRFEIIEWYLVTEGRSPSLPSTWAPLAEKVVVGQQRSQLKVTSLLYLPTGDGGRRRVVGFCGPPHFGLVTRRAQKLTEPLTNFTTFYQWSKRLLNTLITIRKIMKISLQKLDAVSVNLIAKIQKESGMTQQDLLEQLCNFNWGRI